MSVFTDDQKIELLRDLIQIKSENGDERPVADYIKALFDKHGIDCQIIDLGNNRCNLLATLGSGKPVIGLSSHMDVVAAGDPSKWLFDPFQLTEHEGKLYGRGTADTKGGLLSLVMAMIDIKEQNLLTKGTIKLLATAGEESTQLGSSAYYKNGYADDIDCLIIAEPAETMINTGNKGSINLVLKSKGKAAHSSMPNVGVNAIYPLLEMIPEILKRFNEQNDKTTFGSFDFSEIAVKFGGKEGDTEGNAKLAKFLQKAVLTNTMISGGIQVNSVPDYAEASFNGRTVSEFNNEKIKAIFNEVVAEYQAKGHDVSVDITLDLGPIATDSHNDLVSIAKRVGEEVLNRQLLVGPTTGATDASNLLVGKPYKFPFINFGPGETFLAHQLNEYVWKSTYLAFSQIYVRIITDYLKTF